ncbi:D-alanine--D-alanine ligase [Kushneria indalinina]|uniref:D-alanine--D-alanine ligase n=1 Tax=Kushneria indalinina DSM 14324 TaxID=1122140 RepID=A0A3D9DSY0_9GAMM|nr:D-alanine--D-alanine ligase [Kushneria indalinina]REC93765.1 D-alanine-D-alanine ligase [Kushneria indalinina DSM 14324]
MEKIRVGVIFGGKSAEHEVSLQSARNIVDALDRQRFDVTLIGIDKQGQWHVNDADHYLDHADDPARIALHHSKRDLAVMPGRDQAQLIEPEQQQALEQLDVVFPIVHGTLGEDGSLQGLLRMANLPFVGSSVLGSAVSMDKDVTKRLLRDAGLAVAPFVTVTRKSAAEADFDALREQLGTPMFVKPANQGSSVGVSRVDSAETLRKALALALAFDHKVLVESAIQGREIECAILGNDEIEASLCGEIIINDDGFYSYDTKYISDAGAAVAVPAEISDAASDEIRRIARAAFKTLECAGLARVDVFLTPDNRVIINEVNTLPGFTRISMYPKLWQASGLSYPALVTRLIELALDRHEQDRALDSDRHD